MFHNVCTRQNTETSGSVGQAYETEVGNVVDMQPSSRWEKDTETYLK